MEGVLGIGLFWFWMAVPLPRFWPCRCRDF